MAKTIAFTPPPAAVSDLVATPTTGGSLAANTYYYVVVPLTTNTSIYLTGHGGISNQVSATTDVTNNAVQLTWTASPGAGAYVVYRHTVSDTFQDSKRIAPSSWTPTTTTNSYKDTGVGLGRSTLIAVAPASSAIQAAYDVRATGIGTLTMTGGTSVDPITLQDIYNYMSGAGYTAYCSWNKQSFLMKANWQVNSATETYTLFRYADIVWIGYFEPTYSHANSRIQFGELVNGVPVHGPKMTNICGYGANEYRLTTGNYYYNTQAQGIASTHPFYLWDICGGVYCNVNNVAAISKLDLHDFYFLACRNDVPVDSLDLNTGYSDVTNQLTLHSNVKATYYGGQYGSQTRIDRFTGTYNYYQVSWSTSGAARYLNLIDFYSNYGDPTTRLPHINWSDTYVAGVYIDNYRSLRLKVTDLSGDALINSETGATPAVTIYDLNGNVATDWDGTSLQNIAVDPNGYFWRRSIYITASTTTTITSAGAGWTVDQWKGRNLFINGRFVKVKSNTNQVITLCETLTSAPTTSTYIGIIAEIKQARQTHKAAVGNGYGPNYTDTVLYTPHIIKVGLDGYETERVKVTADRQLDLAIKLRENVSADRDSMGSEFR